MSMSNTQAVDVVLPSESELIYAIMECDCFQDDGGEDSELIADLLYDVRVAEFEPELALYSLWNYENGMRVSDYEVRS